MDNIRKIIRVYSTKKALESETNFTTIYMSNRSDLTFWNISGTPSRYSANLEKFLSGGTAKINWHRCHFDPHDVS